MAIIRMNVHGLVLYDVRESYEDVATILKHSDTDFVELHRENNKLPVTLNKKNIMDVFHSERELGK